MSLISPDVILIGLILSADSFSAALAMGFRPFNRKDALKFAFSSGSAEALIAFAGASFGAKIVAQFEATHHWIAFVLLLAVALHMAYEGIQNLRNTSQTETSLQFHSFTKVIIVSFATSLDALGVGVGLGVLDKPITPYIISIGLWAFIATLAGLYLATKISKSLGPIINILGSIILIILAFKMLEI